MMKKAPRRLFNQQLLAHRTKTFFSSNFNAARRYMKERAPRTNSSSYFIDEKGERKVAVDEATQILMQQFEEDRQEQAKDEEHISFWDTHKNNIVSFLASFCGLLLVGKVWSNKGEQKMLADALFDTEERLILIEDVMTSDAWTRDIANNLGIPNKVEELRDEIRHVFITGGLVQQQISQENNTSNNKKDDDKTS